MITIITWLSLFSPIIPIILGWHQRFTLLWLYAATGLFLDNLGMILKYNGINHHVNGNVFVLTELFCISFYYRDRIFPNRKIFAVLTVFLVSGFVAFTLLTTIFELNFLGAGMLCAVYVGYGVTGYLRILQNKEIIDLNVLPFFWINTAFFLSAASNCLLFLFATYLKRESFQLLIDIWGSFFVSINILHYIFIGIGLYKTPLRET